MIDLRSLSLDELCDLVDELGEPRFRGEQIFRWLHKSGVASLDEMGNVPKTLRDKLAARTRLCNITVDTVQVSIDGTRKMRLLTHDGAAIESVLIPETLDSGEKITQCVSSQVGCALGCTFCATATMGLSRNLTAGEIADQVYRARELLNETTPGKRVTNLVYMGMGEPFHNYDAVVASLGLLTHELGINLSHRRITVSTVGLVPALAKFGHEKVNVNLAVSLNATTDAFRGEIMPINRKHNIEKLIDAVRAYPLDRRQRVTFEYVLLAGKNDTLADARRLAKLLAGLRCKVNIIPFNPHPDAEFGRPTAEAVTAFQEEAKRNGLAVYIRRPRGDDIAAACGQLAISSSRTA